MATEARTIKHAGTPIATQTHWNAAEAARASDPWEVADEHNYRKQCDRDRQRSQAASCRSSSPRCAGWSCSSTRVCPCPKFHRELANLHAGEAPTEGHPKKRRCTIPSSDGPACQHVAVKIIPTGPRDNGELYWRCARCNADM